MSYFLRLLARAATGRDAAVSPFEEVPEGERTVAPGEGTPAETARSVLRDTDAPADIPVRVPPSGYRVQRPLPEIASPQPGHVAAEGGALRSPLIAARTFAEQRPREDRPAPAVAITAVPAAALPLSARRVILPSRPTAQPAPPGSAERPGDPPPPAAFAAPATRPAARRAAPAAVPAAEPAPALPPVHISIGVIEVIATPPVTAAASPAGRTPDHAPLSLDAYLAQRRRAR